MRAWPRARGGVRATPIGRDWTLLLLGVLHTLAYGSLFVVMHLRSQSWAIGQVFERSPGYWEWFYRTVFSEDRVWAARRSDAAASHPFLALASFVAISAVYLLLLRRARAADDRQSLSLARMLVLAGTASVPLLLLPHLLSADVYSYISFGRIAVVHGGNPFIDAPADFPQDPFLGWVSWKNVPSVYGPGWIYPSIVLTIVVNSITPSPLVYVLAYKLLALALHLVNGLLIWAILRRWKPEQQTWGTALYLLNPLALVEFAGNAHNDVLMITFILLGVWFHLRGAWYWTIAAWTLATLTKWIALPLLPLYGLALLWGAPTWRSRIGLTLGSLAIFAGLCVGLYRPYWEGPQTLDILFTAPPQKRLINSLGDVLSNEIQRGMWLVGDWPNPALSGDQRLFDNKRPNLGFSGAQPGTDAHAYWQQQRDQFERDRMSFNIEARQANRYREVVEDRIRTGALIMLAAACLLAAAITRTMRVALLAGAWIFFVYSTIGAVWFWPWYVTWFVALAAILDWRVTGRTAVMVSLLVPLIYIFYPTLPDPVWWQRYRAVLVFVPPLLFAGWHGVRLLRELLRGWRAKRQAIATA
jgi:hypothetical protein